MYTPRLVLLQVFFLMVPQGTWLQPSLTPSWEVPTSLVLEPVTQDGTSQSPVENATPRDVPGISTVGPTLVTPSAPGNKTMNLFPGEGRGEGWKLVSSHICNSVNKDDLPQSEEWGCWKRGI
jgi:hypothetical protein